MLLIEIAMEFLIMRISAILRAVPQTGNLTLLRMLMEMAAATLMKMIILIIAMQPAILMRTMMV